MKQKVYVCSKYSTGKNGGCERHKVDEQHLVFLIEQQLKIFDLPPDSFDLVQAIVVTREDTTVYYTGYAPTVGQQPEEYNFDRGEA